MHRQADKLIHKTLLSKKKKKNCNNYQAFILLLLNMGMSLVQPFSRSSH